MKKIVRLTESELVKLVQKVISEQPQTLPFKVGDVEMGYRDKDGQLYKIEITQVGPSGAKWVMAKIYGPGLYRGEKLDGKGQFELYFEDGHLSGNMEMGKFKLKQKYK